MRFLVTGATGFLGGHLVRLLAERGHEVVALARRPSKSLDIPGVVFASGDVLDAASVERAAAGCDGLFHCAGFVSRSAEDADAMWKVHVVGTRTVLEAAKKAGLRRAVVASTRIGATYARTRRETSSLIRASRIVEFFPRRSVGPSAPLRSSSGSRRMCPSLSVVEIGSKTAFPPAIRSTIGVGPIFMPNAWAEARSTPSAPSIPFKIWEAEPPASDPLRWNGFTVARTWA